MVTQDVIFKKASKKYSLVNSYFKFAPYGAPKNPEEIMQYFLEHKELPFTLADEENWLYECFVEFQKRNGVYGSQFFTPPATANRIAELALTMGNCSGDILDACCGFGMLSKPLMEAGLSVVGFDRDYQFKEMYPAHTGATFIQWDLDTFTGEYDLVVSNPPYEIPACALFLERLNTWLSNSGTAILLLPTGFIEKTKPKAFAEAASKFEIIHREPMNETFARTPIRAEILVLERK